jgi:hypothetical protein
VEILITEVQDQRHAAVQKILQSEALRSSDSVRRLLAYLVDKALAGQADQLKEYTLGIDVFGKPPEYDPRHDSGVRLHVGRLRQKLHEYYLTEGKDDVIIVDLPKGGYSLHFDERTKPSEPDVVAVPAAPVPVVSRWPRWLIAGAFLATLAWAVFATIAWRQDAKMAEAGRIARAEWTPDLEALWAPLIESRRPTIFSVSSPLFVAFQGEGNYRARSVNNWDEALRDASLKAVRRALGNPEMMPSRSYTGVGDASAMLQLGKLLGTRKEYLVFSKTADLSWEQLSSNDLVLLGNPSAFTDLLHGMPGQLEIDVDARGLKVLHPGQGQPEILADTFRSDTGEVYALITRTTGPNGKGTVTIFSSNRNPATLGAVQAFTEPAMAASLVRVLRDSSGRLPPYYQIALHVRFKGGVPTETTYALHRVLKALAAVPQR